VYGVNERYRLVFRDHGSGSLKVSRCPFHKSCASTFWRRQRIELGHCRIMFGLSPCHKEFDNAHSLAPHVTLGCDEQSHLESIVRAILPHKPWSCVVG